jgi:GNAT superfamily N-acetyltransferase
VHELERAERFITRLDQTLSERTVPWAGGTAYLHTGLPRVWDLNYMVSEDPTLSAEAIARAADEVMGEAGCKHRRVCVRDAEVGARLESDFTALGWTTDVHVIMGHAREPDHVVDITSVEEVGGATWPSREEQLRSYPWADEATLDQLHTLYSMTVEAANARDFAVLDGGKPVSFALLFTDGATGWIEDVATLEPYRRRGLSRAVMTKALEESRALHDFTFLIADDRDWPKHFYSQLGFDILGRHYYFLKQPPETA